MVLIHFGGVKAMIVKSITHLTVFVGHLQASHEDTCDFMIILCPSCKELMRANEQEHHNERECPERMLNCKYCKGPFQLKNIKVRLLSTVTVKHGSGVGAVHYFCGCFKDLVYWNSVNNNKEPVFMFIQLDALCCSFLYAFFLKHNDISDLVV